MTSKWRTHIADETYEMWTTIILVKHVKTLVQLNIQFDN